LQIGLRVVGRLGSYRMLGQPAPWSGTWLVPIRDLMSFVLGVLSFFGRTVRWNDEPFHVHRDGRLERRPDFPERARFAESAEVPSLASDWAQSASRAPTADTSARSPCTRPRTRASTPA